MDIALGFSDLQESTVLKTSCKRELPGGKVQRGQATPPLSLAELSSVREDGQVGFSQLEQIRNGDIVHQGKQIYSVGYPGVSQSVTRDTWQVYLPF